MREPCKRCTRNADRDGLCHPCHEKTRSGAATLLDVTGRYQRGECFRIGNLSLTAPVVVRMEDGRVYHAR